MNGNGKRENDSSKVEEWSIKCIVSICRSVCVCVHPTWDGPEIIWISESKQVQFSMCFAVRLYKVYCMHWNLLFCSTFLFLSLPLARFFFKMLPNITGQTSKPPNSWCIPTDLPNTIYIAPPHRLSISFIASEVSNIPMHMYVCSVHIEFCNDFRNYVHVFTSWSQTIFLVKIGQKFIMNRIRPFYRPTATVKR